MALYFLERYEEALQAYEQAENLAKNDFERSVIYGYRSATLLKLGRNEDAKNGFEQSVRYHSSQYSSWHGLGESSLALGNIGEAKSAFLKSLELCPTYTDPYFGLALAAEQEGDRATAITFLNKAIEQDPTFYEARQKLAQWKS
jgi:superkiller protein 3